jgi:hypothetical protein
MTASSRSIAVRVCLRPATAVIAIAVLMIVPVSDFVLTAINLDVTVLFKPNTLPKMNTQSGISDAGRTFIVIPTIFNSEETVRALLENIEVHFLANRDEKFTLRF